MSHVFIRAPSWSQDNGIEPFDASMYGLSRLEAASIDTHAKLCAFVCGRIAALVRGANTVDALERALGRFWQDGQVALRTFVESALKDERDAFRQVALAPAAFGQLRRGVDAEDGVLIVLERGRSLRACVDRSRDLERCARAYGMLRRTHFHVVEGYFLEPPQWLPRVTPLAQRREWCNRAINGLDEWGPPVLPHLRWHVPGEP